MREEATFIGFFVEVIRVVDVEATEARGERVLKQSASTTWAVVNCNDSCSQAVE